MKSHKRGKLAQSFHDVNVSLSDCELKHSNCIENRVMILSRALNTTLLQMSSMHALNSLIPSHLRLHFQCIHSCAFFFYKNMTERCLLYNNDALCVQMILQTQSLNFYYI